MNLLRFDPVTVVEKTLMQTLIGNCSSPMLKLSLARFAFYNFIITIDIHWLLIHSPLYSPLSIWCLYLSSHLSCQSSLMASQITLFIVVLLYINSSIIKRSTCSTVVKRQSRAFFTLSNYTNLEWRLRVQIM